MKTFLNLTENLLGILLCLLCLPFMKKKTRRPDMDILLSEYDGKDEGNGEIA